MTCQDIRERIRGWVRSAGPEGLPSTEREVILGHLLGCAACEEEMRVMALKRLLLRATGGAEVDPDPALYARVSVRLRESWTRPALSFWEVVRATAASVVLVATLVLLLLAGASVYIHQQVPTERRDFISALMERNFSEAERVVLAGEGELSPDGVLTALASELRESR